MAIDPNELATLAAQLYVGKFTLDRIAKFADGIFGEAGKDAYASVKMFGKWGCENFTRVFVRSAEIMEVADIFPKQPLSPAISIPLMEAASKVDDPDLSEMFAKLLAASVVDDKAYHPTFIRWLGEMSRTDAQVLDIIAAVGHSRHLINNPPPSNKKAAHTRAKDYVLASKERYGLEEADVLFSLSTLQGMSITANPPFSGDTGANTDLGQWYFITPLGAKFIAICLPAQPQPTSQM